MSAEIRRRLAEIEWAYGDQDPRASKVLSSRIQKTARGQGLITYSDLVRGVTFQLPNINEGRSFEIDVNNWSELDRAIIGEFLGYLSAESYERAGIFVSAVVVTKDDGTPGAGFTKFMRDLGVLGAPSDAGALECWVKEVQKVHKWYGRSPH
ncbi:MAG TPA: hypothetical protein VEW47_10015 [Candidatus Dormibacteraeota bacterium]|nr:hypothetical protein [Candidatus Dormibacteraeota bacterium]